MKDITDFSKRWKNWFSPEKHTELIEDITLSIASKREEIIIEAIEEGYDGVDFIHTNKMGMDRDFQFKERVIKWSDEPPNTGPGVRYDFRYYDRELLLEIADDPTKLSDM